jgi:hypothetical protein
MCVNFKDIYISKTQLTLEVLTSLHCQTMNIWPICIHIALRLPNVMMDWKLCGPYRPDAIWQRDANFQFSMTFNFNIFPCFSNIWNHLSNFSYLVCISCKIFIPWRFYLFLKTENSRRVAESRPVCVGLKIYTHRTRLDNATRFFDFHWPITLILV